MKTAIQSVTREKTQSNAPIITRFAVAEVQKPSHFATGAISMKNSTTATQV